MTASLEDELSIFHHPNWALIPIFTGLLSCLGSYVVIRESWVDLRSSSRQPSMRAPLLRTLIAMSLSDLLMSIAFALTMVPSPRWVTHVPFVRGNYTTCEVQGFFLELGNVATPLFSTLLTYY